MAPTFIQASNVQDTNSATSMLTFEDDVTKGDVIFIVCSWSHNDGGIVVPTATGYDFTLLDSLSPIPGNLNLSSGIYSAVVPEDGSLTITLTSSGGGVRGGACALEYSGMNGTSPFDQHAYYAASGGTGVQTTGDTDTTDTAVELLLAMAGSVSDRNIAVGDNYTQRASGNVSNGGQVFVQDAVTTETGEYNASVDFGDSSTFASLTLWTLRAFTGPPPPTAGYPVDSRDYGNFPNDPINVNNTYLYVVPSVDSRAAGAPVDSRAAGAPVPSGTYPQNSRVPNS